MGHSRGSFATEDSASFVIEDSAVRTWDGQEQRVEVNSCSSASCYLIPAAGISSNLSLDAWGP